MSFHLGCGSSPRSASVRQFIIVKCSQALSSWIKKSSLFCFFKFLCLLYLRICFVWKDLTHGYISVLNQYSINTTWDLSREHWWELIIFESILFLEHLIECICLKCPRSVKVSGKSDFHYHSRGNCILSFQFPFWYTLE